MAGMLVIAMSKILGSLLKFGGENGASLRYSSELYI